jgi:hypothetical protein
MQLYMAVVDGQFEGGMQRDDEMKWTRLLYNCRLCLPSNTPNSDTSNRNDWSFLKATGVEIQNPNRPSPSVSYPRNTSRMALFT